MTTTNSNAFPEAPVGDIGVGERHRNDLGDLVALARSIQDVGLLHPLVVTPAMRLVAGARRLAAVKELGWERVPVRVVDGLDDALAALRAERDENTCRKDFTPSEAVAIGKALEELESAEAKKRQGRPGKERSGNLPEHAKGDTRDKVAEAVGMSGRTYEKAKEVVGAAEKEPEKYGDLTRKMDETGKVDPAHKELKRRGGAAAGKKTKRKRKAGAGKKNQGVPDSVRCRCADELIRLMEDGQVSVADGEQVAYLRKPEQRKLVKAGAAAVKEKAADLRWLRSVPSGNVCLAGFDPRGEVSDGARREALGRLNETMEELKAAGDTLAGWIDTLQKLLPADGAAPEQPGGAQVQPGLSKDGAAA